MRRSSIVITHIAHAVRAARVPLVALVAVAALVGFTASVAPAYASSDPARYDNTYAKDFVMDAPWRVTDAQTPIPLTIVLKDCDADDVRELHWIRCWDVTGGGSTLLWDHNFNNERIGDDASEADYWTYITLVTEGHPSLPNGTLLTPANLGHVAGDAIQLKVSIYYRDDWFNYTETRYLRVRVGGGAFPRPDGWYGGDPHFHTMYTNNIAEFGSPLPAVQLTAIALGLDWLATTDHSCDLDETGDGAYSYATHAWEYTLQTAAGLTTYYRDPFAYGSAWTGLGADVAELDSPQLRLYRGVEINLASIDGDSYGKTLHGLFYSPEYIASPLSGAFGERPVTPTLPAGLDQLGADGFAYAAHPLSDLGTEWGGIDWGVNGARWGDEDVTVALQCEAFRGFEAFNARDTRYSSDTADPWPDFDAGVQPANPYPNALLEGIALWDARLREGLAAPTGTPRKLFLAGASDAHGDFNYASCIALDNYATDNALGKVQTVVYAPGAYGHGNLPPMPELLAAYRAGRSIATDGPFLEIGVDVDGDGDWHGANDLMIGGDGVLAHDTAPPLRVRWASLPEFGPAVSVRIWCADAAVSALLASFDPSAGGEGLAGETAIALAGLGFEGWRCLRAELITADGDAGHRAYTNPIWVRFDASAPVAQEDPLRTPALLFEAGPNPFEQSLGLRYALDRAGSVTLDVLDINGRLVRRVVRGALQAPGRRTIGWDGRDETGRVAPAGAYMLRLRAAGETRTLRCVRVR